MTSDAFSKQKLNVGCKKFVEKALRRLYLKVLSNSLAILTETLRIGAHLNKTYGQKKAVMRQKTSAFKVNIFMH